MSQRMPRWNGRSTPIVGTKLWFEPRRFGGWGWSPCSWEGWATMVAFALVVVGGTFVLSSGAAVALTFACVAALAAVTTLKGTSPGGRSAWKAFREEHDRAD